ncbi:MAG TPA: NPCBM/NEW2 domain-containing protein [Candidatus Limnocylindrales bacterium]|nr:NPCBM/NEW2 domain-containing protein [Candidatus Limnocylindrales bacterium]
MRIACFVCGALIVTAAWCATGQALVTPGELARRDAWVKTSFASLPPAKLPPGLLVLANNDPVIKNNRHHKPLNIAGRPYTHGLFCHALSKVIVQLPGPGRTFTAVVGIDSNEQTSGGRGSVVFSASVKGRQAFQSAVLHEGDSGALVKVDLDGSDSFVLEVGDAGDGIACDQSDWAEAKVVLADGKELWLAELPFLDQTLASGLPFSFIYDGRHSLEVLPSWRHEESSRKLDDARTERTILWTEPRSGLLLRCVSVEYAAFPLVEWTLYFKNLGTHDTPIISDIFPLDTAFLRSENGDFVLHHHAGSTATMDDYRPYETRLTPVTKLRLAASGGRGSDTCWPYFNVDWGNEGAIAAVGWPGQWAATFTHDDGRMLQARAGQEHTRFKLLPGEEARSPLIVLQFWEGDWIKAQNVWRRWMVAYNIPRLNGRLPPPLLPGGSSNQMNEMQNANEENQIQFVDGYLDNGIPITFWWMDAGWYPFKEGWWNTGTWEPDAKRFPHGLRAVTDHAHRRGVNALLWFEPERVQPGTWLYLNHPEWLLGKDGNQKLLNLGNEAARQWVTDHTHRLMQEQGIDIYRQDFNMPPLDYWRANDAPDRQGITEIQHITGYLAFWDELRRRNPGLLIDTCASGGRRNDLETLRRSVPLHKSDMEYPNLTSKQTQFYGLAFWEPYFGAPVYPADHVDVYGFRSGISLLTGLGYDSRRKDLDFALLRNLVAERDEVVPNYYGDYYPLTAWSAEPDVWIAWQFDRPDEGKGVIQAFRRPASVYESARFKLRGLEPTARYSLTNFDVPGTTEAKGSELIDQGLLVTIPARPGAVIITYSRAHLSAK